MAEIMVPPDRPARLSSAAAESPARTAGLKAAFQPALRRACSCPSRCQKGTLCSWTMAKPQSFHSLDSLSTSSAGVLVTFAVMMVRVCAAGYPDVS
eukprot:1389436-Pyramimonas_sp.AAC.2